MDRLRNDMGVVLDLNSTKNENIEVIKNENISNNDNNENDE